MQKSHERRTRLYKRKQRTIKKQNIILFPNGVGWYNRLKMYYSDPALFEQKYKNALTNIYILSILNFIIKSKEKRDA